MVTTTHDEPIMEPQPEPVELTPTEARQASNNKWPMRVLVISTFAAAIGLGLFLIYHG